MIITCFYEFPKKLIKISNFEKATEDKYNYKSFSVNKYRDFNRCCPP